jgi:NADH-quinone oxidoreductase subunit C
MAAKILEILRERFGDAVLETHSRYGDDTAIVARERNVEVLQFLRDDERTLMNFPTDLTAVDFLGRDPRFEIVYHLYSIKLKHRVRIKCRIPEDDCRIGSASELFTSWKWFEREAWDMYGIRFEGLKDHRRMFMYEEFVGHPLRKDYPKEKRQPLIRREGIV